VLKGDGREVETGMGRKVFERNCWNRGRIEQGTMCKNNNIKRWTVGR
jgi:hypothetical protein